MNKENTMVLSVLAVNHPGVLLRLTGLFNRRGFNSHRIRRGTGFIY